LHNAQTAALRAVKTQNANKEEFPSQQQLCNKQNAVAEGSGGHDKRYAQDGAFNGRLAGRTERCVFKCEQDGTVTKPVRSLATSLEE